MPQQLAKTAERVVQTREALGLSQAELCRAIGVERNRWNQYESGARQITVDVALKLKARFGITLDWIYAGDLSSMPPHIVRKFFRVAAQ